jgi:hypothetical protein
VISQQIELNGRPGTAHYVRQGINGLALAAQVTGFIIWPVFYYNEMPHSLLLPIALLFISCGWWENFFTATEIPDKKGKITIELHYTLPPATFPSGISGTY